MLVATLFVSGSALAQDRRSSATDPGDDRGWYAAIGAGVSRLSPDPGNSSLQIEDDASTAVGAWIGRDLSSRFSIEASVARLGEATLTGNRTIGYDAASLGLLGYIFGDARQIARRQGLALYARGGLSAMRNESELVLESADNMALWAAVGVDWPFAPRFGLRAEVASYDGDAQAAFLTVVARAKPSRAQLRTPPDDRQRTSDPADIDRVEAPAPAPAPVLEIAPRPTPLSGVRPGGIALPDTCPAAEVGEPLTEAGCARFAGVLRGVDFVGGSARLTPIGERLLDRLAQELDRYPQVVIEIRAHVAGGNLPERAKALSRERAVATARRLASAGVDVARLRARAFGDTRPRAANDTLGGRRMNDRIEIDVVP